MADWQAGDLALCVRSAYATRSGHIYTVAASAHHMGERRLWFTDWMHDALHREVGSRAVRFRKVTPPRADEFDREVIDLLLGKKVPHHA